MIGSSWLSAAPNSRAVRQSASRAASDLGAATVKTCVLLRKDRPSAREVHVDYVGFEIPDEFVVGYGLDYNNYYRNLPDIVTLKADVIGRA